MSYRIAGIDVHKKMLAVVVSDVEVDGEHQFERRMFGSNPEQLRSLAAWLVEQEAEEVVMESTAQYWKPVWGALERYWKPLHPDRSDGSFAVAQWRDRGKISFTHPAQRRLLCPRPTVSF
jgi:Transposase